MANAPAAAPQPATAPTTTTTPATPVVPAPLAGVSGAKPAATVATAKPVIAIDPSKTANAIKAVAAPFRIEPMQTRQTWMKLLAYGGPGKGKTELLNSAADVVGMRDVLDIDVESGHMTIQETPRIHAESKDHIDSVPITSFTQVAQIYDYLKVHCRFRDANDIPNLRLLQAQVTGVKPSDIPDDKVRKYYTVVVDSVSELDALSMAGVLGYDMQKVMAGDADVAGWPEFRKNNEKMKLLIRSFRDLPIHLLIAAGERYAQDEMKRFHYGPALTGQLQTAVQGFVDIVGRLTIEPATQENDAPRRLWVQPLATGAKFDAKNRRAGFKGNFFDNPTMTTIMGAVGLTKTNSA